MSTSAPAAVEPTLPEFTDGERKTPAIAWYRTRIAPAELKALHQRSDAWGFFQTGGYMVTILSTAALALYSFDRWPWWATVGSVFLHGTVMAFLINGVHELGHGTVFRTKAFNQFFVHVLAFFGWINHEHFQNSHTRHHRYTLHAPDDLEVTLPIRLMVKHFLKTCLVNPMSIYWTVKNTLRLAREWEGTLFPDDAPEKRVATMRWARVLLLGHGLILAVSLAMGWWLVPVVVSLTGSYGGWLQFLCNNTQHIGLQDSVPDFRLCCRTFTLNPVARFLYWHMNYHTEHHMYAAVPCYRLGRLHALIRHDLPPCPDGLAGVWREIAFIQARQDADPSYRHHDMPPGVPVGAA